MKQSLELEAADSLRLKVASHPASKPFRDARSQVRLALSQREEDPARVWLELVSVRESSAKLTELAVDDPILHEDIERFRAKLEAEIFGLQQEVGDEVLAPLYVWLDLIRRRNRLDRDILRSRQYVKDARAARADKSRAPRTVEEAEHQLTAGKKQLDWWRAACPARPSDDELTLWRDGGWDAKRATLPQDGKVIRERGLAARAVLGDVAPARPPGHTPFIGSALEIALFVALGAGAAGATITALLAESIGLGVIAGMAWLSLVAAAVLGVSLRRRARRERQAMVDAVWFFTFYLERTAAMEVEVGWTRALHEAFTARRAFDEKKGEGKQIEDLKKWRPDLRDFVVEVARQGEDPTKPESPQSVAP